MSFKDRQRNTKNIDQRMHQSNSIHSELSFKD